FAFALWKMKGDQRATREYRAVVGDRSGGVEAVAILADRTAKSQRRAELRKTWPPRQGCAHVARQFPNARLAHPARPAHLASRRGRIGMPYAARASSRRSCHGRAR